MAADYSPEFVAYLVDLVYQRGFDDGVRWADETMGVSLRLAIDPGEHVNPAARDAVFARTAGDVVKTVVDALHRQGQQPTNPPVVRLDYKGGPVVWKEAA